MKRMLQTPVNAPTTRLMASILMALLALPACGEDGGGGRTPGGDAQDTTETPDAPDAPDADTGGEDVDPGEDTTPDTTPDGGPDIVEDADGGQDPDVVDATDATDTADGEDGTDPDTTPDGDADAGEPETGDPCTPGETVGTTCENEGEVTRCTCVGAAFVCDPTPCRDDVSCDDGLPLMCDLPRLTCDGDDILAIQDGCWACVPADTCGEVGPDPCETDRDCEAGEVCGDDDTCEASPCPPQGALTCSAPRPFCDEGQVSTVRSGCWACVIEDTCAPAPEPPSACREREGTCVSSLATPCAGGDNRVDGTCITGFCCTPFTTLQCDDGNPLTCGDPWLECPAGEVLSIVSGCWQCRAPGTCGFGG